MKKLEIDDYDLLKSYYEKFRIEASEISFTNLFMWRNKYNFHFEIQDEFLWILNVKNAETIYFSQPIGDYSNDEKLLNSIENMKSKYKGMIIKKTDKRLIDLLSENRIDFTYNEDRDSFGYIYNFDDLKNLPGKDFHKKKTHVNKFMKSYDHWNYEELSEENITEAYEMSEEWFKLHDVENEPDFIAERDAVRDGLKFFKKLSYTGGLIRVDEQVVALTMGEKLNDETIVIHIEKAYTDFPCLYNIINQQYLLNQSYGYMYVNREQDLGLEGLRRAKLSYRPIKFIEKYIVRL
ncbi:MAG: DUF2156 domain-containing protein [Clostridiales bacterium]|nr:DUF2156 domain-containing protein [Clostridiales bacterium]